MKHAVQRGRILHIVGAAAFGGIAPVVVEATKAARAAGWAVDLVASDPEFRRIAAAAGAGIVDLDVAIRPIRPVRDLHDLWRIVRYLRSSSYDIVQTHTWKGSILGRLAGRLAHVPVVIATAHGTPWSESAPAAAVRAGAVVERVAARWCDKIVSVSAFHRDWYVRLGVAPMEKFVVIWNGVPEARVCSVAGRDEVRRRLGLDPGTLAVLFAGRLIPQKGVFDLVDAVGQTLIRTSRSIQVLIAGAGPARDGVERQIDRMGLTDHIRMLGFRDDLADLLAAADVVAFPSHRSREGFPVVLVEALAAGRAIVASALGCNLELLGGGRGARLFEPGRSAGLADALVELAESPGLTDRLGDEARQLYLERYTAESMHQAYAHLYEELTTPT